MSCIDLSDFGHLPFFGFLHTVNLVNSVFCFLLSRNY